MATLIMSVELDYDADSMHNGDEPESKEWFFSEILCGDKGQLLLHSNEIGDTVGAIKVIQVFGLSEAKGR